MEPLLTPLMGEEILKSSNLSNQARADMSARGLWINKSVHKKNENEKKWEYHQQILQVEHGSFTPLVFSCFGGMSRECSHFFLHTANALLIQKQRT